METQSHECAGNEGLQDVIITSLELCWGTGSLTPWILTSLKYPPLSHSTSLSPLSLPTITAAFQEETQLSFLPPAARGDVGKPPCRPHSRAAPSILLFPWGDDVAPGPLTICVPAASRPSQPSAKNTAGTGHVGALQPKEPPAHSTEPSAAPGG